MARAERDPRWSWIGFTKYRRAWLETYRIKAAIYCGVVRDKQTDEPDEDFDRHYGADDVIIQIEKGKSRLFIDLTSMTEEELTAFRNLVTMACDAALPASRYIDEAARAAVEADEHFDPRPFRVQPVFHTRNWDGTVHIPDNNKESNEHHGSGGPPD
jgi:hypothetical protein